MTEKRGLQTLQGETQAAFIYCCPDCPSCLVHLNSIGWVNLAIWAMKKHCRSINVSDPSNLAKFNISDLNAKLTLTVLVATIDALQHFETG